MSLHGAKSTWSDVACRCGYPLRIERGREDQMRVYGVPEAWQSVGPRVPRCPKCGQRFPPMTHEQFLRVLGE